MALDSHGTGLVPLERFYLNPHAESRMFNFVETVALLDVAGAIDRASSPGYPQLRIANYVLGASNCIADWLNTSVCCPNECDALLSEVANRIMTPSATPGRLLEVISNTSSSTVDAPRVLPRVLQQRLQSIAAANGGQVAIHGRLFLQWLHFAFPYECPFPTLPEESKAFLMKLRNEKLKIFVDSEEERASLGVKYSRANAPVLPFGVVHELVWSEEERTPLAVYTR